MVEEAVEEVLELVKKAAQQFKSEELQPEFDFMNEDGMYYFLFPIKRLPFGIQPHLNFVTLGQSLKRITL